MILYYQNKFLRGWALMHAYRYVASSTFAGIVDQVRNKALTLALELQSEIGDDASLSAKKKTEVVEKTVTNVIYGGNYFP